MGRLLKRRPSPAMFTAVLALIIATGGTSYAAIKLPANSVGTKQLKANSVVSSKIKDGTLKAKDFAVGQIPSGPQGLSGPPGLRGLDGIAGPQGRRAIPGQRGHLL
jgi:hypothetical protein